MPKISKYNGGYVIISLNDEDIYEKIERNLYKPILLTDIVINGIEKNDVFTTAYVEGTNIVFKDIYDKDITITQDNEVTIGDSGKHLYRNIIIFKNVNLNASQPINELYVSFISNKQFSSFTEAFDYILNLGINIEYNANQFIVSVKDNDDFGYLYTIFTTIFQLETSIFTFYNYKNQETDVYFKDNTTIEYKNIKIF